MISPRLFGGGYLRDYLSPAGKLDIWPYLLVQAITFVTFPGSSGQVRVPVSAGHLPGVAGQLDYRNFRYGQNFFFPPNSPYEFDRKRYKIILGIRYDNSNKMDFHEKIAFSTLQDNLQKWTGKSVLQTRKSVLQEYNVL